MVVGEFDTVGSFCYGQTFWIRNTNTKMNWNFVNWTLEWPWRPLCYMSGVGLLQWCRTVVGVGWAFDLTCIGIRVRPWLNSTYSRAKIKKAWLESKHLNFWLNDSKLEIFYNVYTKKNNVFWPSQIIFSKNGLLGQYISNNFWLDYDSWKLYVIDSIDSKINYSTQPHSIVNSSGDSWLKQFLTQPTPRQECPPGHHCCCCVGPSFATRGICKICTIIFTFFFSLSQSWANEIFNKACMYLVFPCWA